MEMEADSHSATLLPHTTEQGKEIRLKYEALPSKARVHKSPAHNLLLLGGYGDGKTSCMVNDLLDIALGYPGARILLARFTYREIEDTVKRTLREWIPFELYREKKSEEIFQLNNGSEFIFRSLDSPDKYGGLEICAFGIDEAKEVPEDVYIALLGRRRQPGVPENLRRGILCSNPPTKNHWLYKWFGPDRVDKVDFATFHGTTYENAANLPDGYIKTMEVAYKHRITLYKRYVLGEWGADVSGEPVHPGFSEDLHVDSNRDPEEPYIFNASRPLVRGFDFGATTGGCVVWQLDDRRRVRILAEFPSSVPTNIFGGVVKSMCRTMFPKAVFKDWGDPTGRYPSITTGESCFKIMSDMHDIHVTPPPITKREDRAEAVDIWLNQLKDGVPCITLPSPERTPLLFNGFLGEYSWDRDRFGAQKEKIAEGVDCIHLMDAFQYSFIAELGLFPWLELGKEPDDPTAVSLNDEPMKPLVFKGRYLGKV